MHYSLQPQALLLLALSSTIALAQPGTIPPKPNTSNAPPIPRYEVKRTASPPVIDSKLDEKTWEVACDTSVSWEDQTGAKQKTSVRMLWDDRNLYLAYDCEDADITAPFQNATIRPTRTTPSRF